MYHKGYVESLPVQLPEITKLIKEYFEVYYDHNYICRHKKKLVENFIEDFIPWLNSGHLKFKGLKDFKHVYITNGVTEFIQIVMPDHSLRPVTHHEKEYSAYNAHASAYIRSGVKLKNKVDVVSLPFCRTADIHPKTCEILDKPSLVDLAWAGNSGIKETFDLSKVDYATFSFSKCFGVHYHRIGISFSKKPIETLDLEKGFDYVNVVSMELMKFIMSRMSPSYLYDKYKDIAHKFCVENDLEPTKSLWMGLKDGDRKSLLEYWMNYLNENRKPRVS